MYRCFDKMHDIYQSDHKAISYSITKEFWIININFVGINQNF